MYTTLSKNTGPEFFKLNYVKRVSNKIKKILGCKVKRYVRIWYYLLFMNLIHFRANQLNLLEKCTSTKKLQAVFRKQSVQSAILQNKYWRIITI